MRENFKEKDAKFIAIIGWRLFSCAKINANCLLIGKRKVFLLKFVQKWLSLKKCWVTISANKKETDVIHMNIGV